VLVVWVAIRMESETGCGSGFWSRHLFLFVLPSEYALKELPIITLALARGKD